MKILVTLLVIAVVALSLLSVILYAQKGDAERLQQIYSNNQKQYSTAVNFVNMKAGVEYIDNRSNLDFSIRFYNGRTLHVNPDGSCFPF
jgi:hypothetical protein